MQRQFLTVFLAIAAAAAGVVVAGWLSRPSADALDHLTVLSSPRNLPATISVVDDDGETRALNSFSGGWSLVFAGFTYCPDICPTTLAQLAQVHAAIPEVTVTLFSVDPERDGPARLKTYVDAFDPSFNAFTAPEPTLSEAARALSVAYAKVPQGDSYTVDHSSAVGVLDPEGRLVAFITPPFDVPGIIEELRTLMGRGE